MAVQPWAGALAVVLLSVAAWIFVTTSPARDFGVGRYFCCANTLCRHDRLDGMGSGSEMLEYLAGFPTEAVHMMRTSISAGRQANESALVVVLGASIAQYPYAVNYYADLVVPLSARLVAVEANTDIIPHLERRLGELGVDLSRTTVVNAVVGREGEQVAFATVPGAPQVSLADAAEVVLELGAAPGDIREVFVPGISTRDLLERARARPSDVSMLTIDFVQDGTLLKQLFELPGFAPSVVLHHTVKAEHVVVVTQFLADRGYDVTNYGMYAVAFAASSAAVELCEGERSSAALRSL